MSVPTIRQFDDVDSDDRPLSGQDDQATIEERLDVEARSPAHGASYIAVSENELLPPQDFKPFFTLIEDADTGDVHHPTVHYVFSDDDPDLLTSAALNGLEYDEQECDNTKDRFMLVDVGADGKAIKYVSSFTPNWQATHTEVSQAPSWSAEAKSAEKAMMLRISGKEAFRESGNGKQQRRAQLEQLVQDFNEQLGALEELMIKGDIGRETGERSDT